MSGASGSGSAVEHHLAKVRVAGSNPVFRSIECQTPPPCSGGVFDARLANRNIITCGTKSHVGRRRRAHRHLHSRPASHDGGVPMILAPPPTQAHRGILAAACLRVKERIDDAHWPCSVRPPQPLQ